MKRFVCAGSALLVLAAAMPAFAQQFYSPPEPPRPLSGFIGGGYSITSGTMGRYLDNGGILSVGLNWQPRATVPLSLRLAGHYSTYNATRRLINLGSVLTQTRIDDGNGSTLGLDLNAVYDMPLGWARAYTTAGVGLDRRRIELTQTSLFRGFVCDDFWGVCGLGVFPGDILVASDTTTHFAWNAGIGVEFPAARGAWFVQATFHRIETRRPTDYIPIEFGYRF